SPPKPLRKKRLLSRRKVRRKRGKPLHRPRICSARRRLRFPSFLALGPWSFAYGSREPGFVDASESARIASDECRTTGKERVMDFSRFTTLTFDCYGTLIEWEAGILPAMRTILGRHGKTISDAEILALYGDFESEAERPPYRKYRDVLNMVVRRFGERL